MRLREAKCASKECQNCTVCLQDGHLKIRCPSRSIRGRFLGYVEVIKAKMASRLAKLRLGSESAWRPNMLESGDSVFWSIKG